MEKPRTPNSRHCPGAWGVRIGNTIEPSGGEGKRGGTHKQVGTLCEVYLMASRWRYVPPDPKCKPDLVEVAIFSSLVAIITITAFNRETHICGAYRCWTDKMKSFRKPDYGVNVEMLPPIYTRSCMLHKLPYKAEILFLQPILHIRKLRLRGVKTPTDSWPSRG